MEAQTTTGQMPGDHLSGHLGARRQSSDHAYDRRIQLDIWKRVDCSTGNFAPGGNPI